MLAQSLKDAIKFDGEAMAEAKKNKATSEEAKALAEVRGWRAASFRGRWPERPRLFGAGARSRPSE